MTLIVALGEDVTNATYSINGFYYGVRAWPARVWGPMSQLNQRVCVCVAGCRVHQPHRPRLRRGLLPHPSGH